jgi:YNFM family putative membrane transporter
VTEDKIHHGTPEFRRTNLALFSAGFATFAMLYCVQPLLPVFSREFHVSAAASSLSMSLSTGTVAVALLVGGSISDTRGRKGVMAVSLFATGLLTLLVSVAPTWKTLLAVRALLGIALAGFPAVSMAYLGEEMSPGAIGLAMGLSISGNGIGGMTGRLLTGLMTDAAGWRVAIAIVGVLGLAATAIFWKTLPESRHFVPREPVRGAVAAAFKTHLRDPHLVALFAEAFLLMGSFVTLYNYVSYRLLDLPYGLSQSVVGLIFTVYLVGIVASAWMGHLATRVGRRKMLLIMICVTLAGVGLTLAQPLAVVVLGIAVATFGFFGAHSTASSWVGLFARTAKAQASALYFFCFYTGSGVAGSLGGWVWTAWRWPGVAAYVGAMLLVGLALALRLERA